MNKILVLLLIVSSALGISSCKAQNKETMVLIKTEFGDMKLKLYDDTPEHKKNFLKLVNEDFYDGVLFHRVIKNFMIQGGDPDSKNAQPGVRLGGGSPDYTIPAEITTQHIHKKGVLAAARKGGPSNPEKRSSGSQFYIVQGDLVSEGLLDTMETMVNNRGKNECFKKCFQDANAELSEFRKNGDEQGFNIRVAEIREEADSIWTQQEHFSYTPKQREIYTTIGGYPSLDSEYTVFGELVEGFDVLDKIAAVETDKYDRPISNIKMTMEVIK